MIRYVTASNTNDSLVLHRKAAANSAFESETNMMTSHWIWVRIPCVIFYSSKLF